MRGCGLDSTRSGYGPVAGCCEHGNEPSRTVKGGECLDRLRVHQLLKKVEIVLAFLPSPHACYMPRPSHSWYDHRKKCEEYKL
jgi:hypothetical protein